MTGTDLRRVTVLVHCDPAGAEVCWWAESPDFPGFTTAADTLGELRLLLAGALPEVLETDGPIHVTERLVAPDEPVEWTSSGGGELTVWTVRTEGGTRG